MLGDEYFVKRFLQRGKDPALLESSGENALHTACSTGIIDMVDLLIACGCSVNIKKVGGATPLMLSCKEQAYDIAELLLLHGADVNMQDESGQTAIMYAIAQKDLTMVKLLLGHKANMELRDHFGRTALLFAIHTLISIEIEELRLLKEELKQAITNKNRKLATQIDEKVKLAQSHYQDNQKTIAIAFFLIDSLANLNAQDLKERAPLHYALEKKQAALLSYLLEKGADPLLKDKKEKNFLDYAEKEKISHPKLVEEITKAKVIHHYEPTAKTTEVAIATPPPETPKSLPRSPTTDARNQQGQTSLMVASYRGDDKSVATLLKLGADVNLQDHKQHSALMFAASQGHLIVVKLLVMHNAQMELKNHEGLTALALACISNQAKIALFLIAKGAKSSFTFEGKSLLSLASIYDSIDVAKALIKSGMNPFLKDQSGKSAVEYAVLHKKKKVIMLYKKLNRPKKKL